MKLKPIQKWSILALLIFVFFAVLFYFFSPGTTEELEIPGAIIEVQVARTVPQQVQGLSGVALQDFEADGMLFVYDSPKERNFWMKGMEFDLDFVWIREGKIVRIHRNVPAPKDGEEPRTVSSSPLEVDAVLELPAGQVNAFGLKEGQSIPGLKE